MILLQFIVSAFATLSFAVLFHAPRKELLYCGLTGGVGWVVYLICQENGSNIYIACLLATFFLTLLARIFSAVRRNPVTIYLVTGIFPLVPGAGIYYTAYYLIMGEMTQFSSKGVETFLIAGSISLGIVFGFAIPQNIFNTLQKKEKTS